MDEHIAATEPCSDVRPSPFDLQTCPGCAGAIYLRAAEDDRVEEVCEVCGPIQWLFVGAPRENNPKPPKKSEIGKAPMPLGMEEFFKPLKVEEPKQEPAKVAETEPCSST